jgi:hypothetical protein
MANTVIIYQTSDNNTLGIEVDGQLFTVYNNGEDYILLKLSQDERYNTNADPIMRPVLGNIEVHVVYKPKTLQYKKVTLMEWERIRK